MPTPDFAAIGKSLRGLAELFDPQTTPAPTPTPQPTPAPVPSPAPSPSTGFVGRLTPDPSKWKVMIEDDFKTLAPEGKFLSTYGARWSAAGDSGDYFTTSKRGKYDPNRISVVDLPTGERVMQCRLTPRSSSSGYHLATNAQFKVNGSGYNGTRGEIIQVRAKVLQPADNWHAANLGWPPKDSDWPKNGEPDFWESGLTANDTVDAHIHVQNGGSSGQGQVNLSSSAKVTEWFTVAFERVPGSYFAWYVNGQQLKRMTDAEVKSKQGPNYGVPLYDLRWTLQLEDSQGGNPTKEAIVVYDWATLWSYTG